MKKITLLIAVVLALSVSAQRTAKNYLVQLGGGNGATWTKTLGANDSIVDLTVEGKTLTGWLTSRTSWITASDQVWVAAGTYNITANYYIGSAPSLTTAYPSAIYGGFTGTENAIADRTKGTNIWDYSNETIINGSASTGTYPGILNAGGARSMTLDGLTFTGCTNTQGQAVYMRPNMKIQNCKFTSNSCVALRYYTSTASSSVTLSNCYFKNNSYTVSAGTEAGCLSVQNNSVGGTVTVSGCVFDSNTSTASGSGSTAGLKAFGTNPVNILACIFKNNSATAGNASAVALTSATSTLTNCLIYGAPTGSVNALYITGGSLVNCTVVNNLGGGAYMNNTTSATAINLINTVFWGSDTKSGQISAFAGTLGNLSNCAYTNLSSNYAGTNVNNVDLSPTSVGIFNDPANNNWQLATGSILIDMGTSTGAPTTDIRGLLRAGNGAIDIGAYEFGATISAVNNPFEDKKMAVRYSNHMLISQLDGKIQVYTTSGKLLINKTVIAGDALKLSSGIYIVTLTNSNESITQKVVF